MLDTDAVPPEMTEDGGTFLGAFRPTEAAGGRWRRLGRICCGYAPPDWPHAYLDAYDLYLRALPHMATMMPDEARIATGFLRDALKLDPNYAAAHAYLGLVP